MRLHPARAAGMIRAPWTPGWARDELWRRARATPSLDLRFAEGKSLVDATTGQNLVTFTRASEATFVNSQGQIQTAAIDAPRFDHNPTTGESLGLLVEQETQNLLLDSENLATTWSNNASSETTDAITAPNGTLTADKLEEDATAASHYILQAFTPVNATYYTFSVFLKAAERSFAFVGFNTGSLATTFVSVDLSTGTISTATGTPFTSAIQAFPNGWYRVSIALISTGTTTSSVDLRISTDGVWANRSYAGSAGSGIYVWGAQLEANRFATSYIPTSATPITRSADLVTITGSAFSGFYRTDESTIYTDTKLAAGSAVLLSTTRTLVDITDGTQLNRIGIRTIQNNTLRDRLYLRSNAGTEQNFFNDVVVTDSPRKIAAAFKANDCASAASGSTSAATLGTATFPVTVDQITIGSNVGQAASAYHSGTIARLTYWPARLSNETLLRLTQ